MTNFTLGIQSAYIYVTVAVLAAVSALLFFTSLITYFIVFYSNPNKEKDIYRLLDGSTENRKKCRALIDNLVKVPYEDVYITSFDGLRLHGSYYHVKDGAPVEIMVHGYRGTGVRDFAGGAAEAMMLSHNVLLVDSRANGGSEGRTITFGVKERYDVLSFANYCVMRFGEDVKILLKGISMGGATVLCASELDLPRQVVGICADCPFSSPKEIICKMIKEKGLPVWYFYPLIRFGARLFGRFDIEGASAAAAVKHSKVPILIIHGKADTFVPPEMSEKIARATDKATLILVDNATHGLSYIYDREGYMSGVLEFTEKTLGFKEELKVNEILQNIT